MGEKKRAERKDVNIDAVVLGMKATPIKLDRDATDRLMAQTQENKESYDPSWKERLQRKLDEINLQNDAEQFVNNAGETVTREDLKSGFKADGGKPAMNLLPPHAMLALGDLFRIGASKYEDRNWEKGMSWGRMIAACLRHMFKFMAGEDYGPVDGQHHLISVAWCAMCLYEYTVSGIGTDDRTKLRIKKKETDE